MLLSDDDDKTRANAAGALGNLVRNSNQLCPVLIQHNVFFYSSACESYHFATHQFSRNMIQRPTYEFIILSADIIRESHSFS